MAFDLIAFYRSCLARDNIGEVIPKLVSGKGRR
jgi:hypothetical protein